VNLTKILQLKAILEYIIVGSDKIR